MWIPFDKMPASARVWLYAVERPLTADEAAQANDFLQASIQDWRAHGVPMKASFQIYSNQLIVLVADEAYTAASGCSIDASTRWFKSLSDRTGLDWFDRSLFFVNEDGGLGKVSTFGIKKAISEGILTPETKVYPAQVDSLADWYSWPRPAQDSTLRRYFATVS